MAEKIAVIGDGAMGTVCAMILANKGYRVSLWSYSAEQIAELAEYHENRKFLPDIRLPLSIDFVADDGEVFRDASLVVSAVPCAFLRAVWGRLAVNLPAKMPVVSITKGIEDNTLLRPTQIIEQTTGPRRIAVLSGPNIAHELARSLPATATVAASDAELAGWVQKCFNTKWLRIYTNTDVLGVELAGATKNVIAIAAGIIDGLAAGDNAKAALITRGLAEIVRLGLAKGAKAGTLMGLSGIGDLVLTCNAMQSRNFSLGFALGQGEALDGILAARASVAEGVFSAASVSELAGNLGVDMPLSLAVDGILNHFADIDATIEGLLARPVKLETASEK